MILGIMSLSSVASGAESRALDDLGDIGVDGTTVTERTIYGTTVDIDFTTGTMTARTYGSGPTAFDGAGGSSNVLLDPDSVSGALGRFVSTSSATSGYFSDVTPIDFTFSTPIQSFGLTTVDLMETGLPVAETVTFRAYNSSDVLVAEQIRTGPQGASGLDLNWLVTSSQQDIVRVSLSGTITSGDGYGIDDVVVGLPTADHAVWGNNEYGQISTTPPSGDFTDVAAGANHTVALRADGTVVAWGRDDGGQVTNTPTSNDFVAVGAGHSRSMAIREDGSIVVWGDVTGTPTGDFVEVAGGLNHYVALSSDNSLASWGNDTYGQVGDTPTSDDFVAVDATLRHSIALREDGTIVAWGIDDGSLNDYGQVTDTPTGDGFIAVAAGGYHNLALLADGSIFSWGRDDRGQVTDTPTGNDFIAIAGGYTHSLALKSDGTIVAWGSDNWGQVSLAPTTAEFATIAAGKHSIGLVPEPGTLSVLALGGFGMFFRRRHQSQGQAALGENQA